MLRGLISGVLWGVLVAVIGVAVLSLLVPLPPRGAGPAKTPVPSVATAKPSPVAAARPAAAPPAQPPAATAKAAAPVPAKSVPAKSVTAKPVPAALPSSAPRATAIGVPAGSAFDGRKIDREAVLPPPEAQPRTAAGPQAPVALSPDQAPARAAGSAPAPVMAPVMAPETGLPAPKIAAGIGGGIGGGAAAQPGQVLPAQTAPRRLLAASEADRAPGPATSPPAALMAPESGAPESGAPPTPTPPIATPPSPQLPKVLRLGGAEPPVQAGAAGQSPGAGSGLNAAPAGALPTPQLPRVLRLGEAKPPERAAGVAVEQLPHIGVAAPAAPAPQPEQVLPAQKLPTQKLPAQKFPAPKLPGQSVGSLIPSGQGAASPEPGSKPGSKPGPEPGLVANAVAFENPRGLPLMAVILIDDPARPLKPAALKKLPFAVTFAIDPNQSGAATTARRYRDAGFEVMILSDLPKGATPADVEVTFQADKARLPQAVALMDRNLNGFQSSRDLVRQAVANLAESGLGFVSYDKGLNSARQLAQRVGVKAGLVFRTLDAGGEKAPLIDRYLNRAAFRAAQEGYVIVLGHSRPETIAALVLWGLGDRAASVAEAPLSAVLNGL